MKDGKKLLMNVVVAWISQRGGNNHNLLRAAAAAAISRRWSAEGHVEGLHHFFSRVCLETTEPDRKYYPDGDRHEILCFSPNTAGALVSLQLPAFPFLHQYSIILIFKSTVFCDAVPSSLVQFYRRSRSACILHHEGDSP